MTYAIFRAAGQQFRAEEGARVRVPKLEGDPGAKVSFDDVLLTSDGNTVKAGQPTVTGAKVTAEIVRHGRADKIVVFRFKRRKNYRKKTGHRQEYTELQITDVKA
ncbi:MAG: 50S ribosomal protein L21 [Gemmatimonas sp. SG8_28]|jgi:large subunit ribosomal protein L21|nr:MAG: 50S ribosomal protein L21 [Gemmatimonas sp. SG8_28]